MSKKTIFKSKWVSVRNLSLYVLGIISNRLVSRTKLGPIINTMGRRLLVLSIVLASTTSIAAPAVQDGDEYARWPRAEKPFWNPHKVPKSLCDLNKEVISYTCELVNQKMVSVCASRNLAPGTGYIVYRYGLPRNIELAYPKESRNTVGLFFYSNRWAQLGGQTSLSFFNKPYRYTVFDDWFVKGKDTVYRAGISVRNEKKIVFQKMCLGNSYYTTGRVFSETPKSISHHWGTNFVFDFPSGLNLKTNEFMDVHVANESRN
jgi:hypothetical protein